MITEQKYLMGREKEYPLDEVKTKNMKNLLKEVNGLLSFLNTTKDLSSGYRPGKYNKAAGGSQRSAHLSCEAIDLIDDSNFGEFLKSNQELLIKFNLYLEEPAFTVKIKKDGTAIKWVHLQTRPTKNRVFIPR